MLYRVGRLLVRVALTTFFKAITVRGEPLEERGPLLVVGNHPNQMLDPFLIDHAFQRPLWYLAKSTLFCTWLSQKVLTAAHLIPIYRRQDNVDTTQNEQSFRKAVERLSAAGAVVIFPEGTSLGEQNLLPLKSGAARIALQAEAQAKWSLGLKIQPVGLTYGDMYRFQSTVTVTAGAPILVASMRNHYEEDSGLAVRVLTESIEEKLRAVTIDVGDARRAALVTKLSRVYEDPEHNDDRERLELIARNCEAVLQVNPAARDELEGAIDQYLAMIDVLGAEGSRDILNPSAGRLTWWYFPFVSLGIAVALLPYSVIRWYVGRSVREPVYVASTKFTLGIILYPLWFLVIGLLVGWISSSIIAAVGATLLSSVLCYGALRGFVRWRIMLLTLVWPVSSSPLRLVRAMRGDLVRRLDELRVV